MKFLEDDRGARTLGNVGLYGGKRWRLPQTYQSPANWQGRRIRIAFDAVYSGAEVWWNGRRVGSHLGGATPFQLDVTAAAKTGDNVIAVRVAQETIASRMDHMSMYADFPLAGIMRRAYVFSIAAAPCAAAAVAR